MNSYIENDHRMKVIIIPGEDPNQKIMWILKSHHQIVVERIGEVESQMIWTTYQIVVVEGGKEEATGNHHIGIRGTMMTMVQVCNYPHYHSNVNHMNLLLQQMII